MGHCLGEGSATRPQQEVGSDATILGPEQPIRRNIQLLRRRQCGSYFYLPCVIGITTRRLNGPIRLAIRLAQKAAGWQTQQSCIRRGKEYSAVLYRPVTSSFSLM